MHVGLALVLVVAVHGVLIDQARPAFPTHVLHLLLRVQVPAIVPPMLDQFIPVLDLWLSLPRLLAQLVRSSLLIGDLAFLVMGWRRFVQVGLLQVVEGQ